MPYLWSIGLIYFGLNDNIPGVVGWCLLFLMIAKINQLWVDNRETIMVMFDIIYMIINQRIHPQSSKAIDIPTLDLVLISYLELKRTS